MSNAEMSIGEIAARVPAATRVFDRHHIDYWCAGKRTLTDACRLAGSSVAAVIEEIGLAANQTSRSEVADCYEQPLWRMIHFMDRFHGRLWSQLYSIKRKLDALAAASGPERSMLPLRRVFFRFQFELEEHMNREEHFVFPAITALENGSADIPLDLFSFGSLRNPISMLEHEHASMAQFLDEMRDLTYGYALPPNASRNPRAVYQDLETLEADMHTYIHVENNILFPRALRLEQEQQCSAMWRALAREARETRGSAVRENSDTLRLNAQRAGEGEQ